MHHVYFRKLDERDNRYNMETIYINMFIVSCILFQQF